MKEIQSLQHPIVKTFVKLRTFRKKREEIKQIVLPGIKLCQEAPVLDVLLIKKGETSVLQAKEIYYVSESILKKATGHENPESVAGIAPLPKWSSLHGKSPLIAIDRISDPGNLGTLLRTALALGWEGAFLTPSTVDPFNEKALRASMGACLSLPLRMGSYEELMHLSKEENLVPVVADMKGTPLCDLKKVKRPLLILGSEAHGVSLKLKTSFQKVSIPIKSMESLNVAAAGAILMYNLIQ